jgi:hypothetical protein
VTTLHRLPSEVARSAPDLESSEALMCLAAAAAWRLDGPQDWETGGL